MATCRRTRSATPGRWTQSPINPDSGSPVVNDAGEIVAVVSGRQSDASLMVHRSAECELISMN
jgi:hypothetical protein